MIRAWGVVVLVLLLAGEAQAEDFVRDDCRGAVQATQSLRFETPLHARWYKRFWTGACEDLSFCFPGSPNWNEVVGKLLTRGGPAERTVLLPKACRLGQTIGLEWARDRRIKRIQTNDLRTFNAMLEESDDALRGIERVESRTHTMLLQH
ncbi:MAG: hypothetical protein KKC14_11780 [Alphaproteobacteria bacterium]|nr:hypothetical protein [Alphaproteobacteria bacterium]